MNRKQLLTYLVNGIMDDITMNAKFYKFTDSDYKILLGALLVRISNKLDEITKENKEG